MNEYFEYLNNSGKNNETTTFWADLKSGYFASMIKETAKGNILRDALEVYNIMKPIFARHDDVERMYGIFLDAKNKVICIEKLFSGSLLCSATYPREIIKWVLTKKAAAIILTHNHPSGSIEPSTDDRRITAKICVALSSIGVPLHDHLIVGDSYYSFAEQGWLAKTKQKYDDFISISKYVV